jgi:D-threo-aldose 1-dehydrogenase
MPELFGHDTSAADAIELVGAALDGGIRTIDTSNGYSDGESERRIGAALRAYGSLPDDTLITTKVDPVGADYSGQRVRDSLRESSQRLGLDYLPVVLLHDPEFHDFDYITAPGGAVDALIQAKKVGQVGHIGIGAGDTRVISRYLDLGVFEVLLTHNRWTLADRSSAGIIGQAVASGMGILNAAVHGGGILTDPPRQNTIYGYRPAQPEKLDAIEQMRQVCRRYGTDLGTAAVRFSTRDSRFSSTVIGLSSTRRLQATIDAATVDLPDALFTELEALLPAPHTWLDA